MTHVPRAPDLAEGARGDQHQLLAERRVATGCSYRRRLEAWLGGARVAPERVMEFGSYHAIVACVAAGAGLAIVPRSVIRVSLGAADVAISPLPPALAKARTFLVWRRGHRSIALDALRAKIRPAARPAPA